MKNHRESAINDYTVSVIVPTMCEGSRSSLLNRAIQSILSQSDVSLEVLIVVNGKKFDPQLLSVLQQDDRLKIIHLEEANVSSARYEGVLRATSDYFCFLDDDDEFLPGALNKRVSLFVEHDDADVIVTNGFEHRNGEDVPLVEPGSAEDILKTPGECFLSRNWFASPAALFKRSSIGPRFFHFNFKYFEWTYLFFLLLSENKKVHYDEVFSYRKYEDNPLSVSKSIEYSLGYPNFLNTLKQLPLSPNLKRIIHEKYITALNTQSNLELKSGLLARAWMTHIKCMFKGGWRYIPFTRHLLIR